MKAAKRREALDRENVEIAQDYLRELVVELSMFAHEAQGSCVSAEDLARVRDMAAGALVSLGNSYRPDNVVQLRTKGGAT